MMPPNKTEPIKPGAKLDPKGTAMVKKIKGWRVASAID